MSQTLVLEQATNAAQQANWSLVNHYLQQLLGGDNRGAASGKSELLKVAGSELLAWAVEVLEAGDFQERWEVAKLFPSLGTEAIAPLIAILRDEDAEEELRWFAARILGQFDRPDCIEALVEVLQTSESEELSAMSAQALTGIGASAIAALTELLAREEWRLLAARSLAQIGTPEAIEPLLFAVKDASVQVRTTAVQAIGNFRDDRALPVLIAALKDTAASVRREAVTGLGLRAELLEEAELVTLLRDRLWDFNLEVCQQAAIALGRLGTEAAAAALFEVLRSPATPLPLQLEVARVLGWMETASSVEYLQQILASQTQSLALVKEIITVLGRLSQPIATYRAAKILAEFLKSEQLLVENAEVKSAIAHALGQLGEQQAIDTLTQLLADADAGVRLHAIAALKQLAPVEARQKLEQLAHSEQVTAPLKEGIAIALQEWR